MIAIIFADRPSQVTNQFLETVAFARISRFG